jgi:peptide alpha-N-acetyltransferase
MYHNMLLEETADFQAALDHLEKIQPEVTDKRAWKEKKALYLGKLGKKEQAEAAYRDLIRENPNDANYINALLALKEKGNIYNRENTEC